MSKKINDCVNNSSTPAYSPGNMAFWVCMRPILGLFLPYARLVFLFLSLEYENIIICICCYHLCHHLKQQKDIIIRVFQRNYYYSLQRKRWICDGCSGAKESFVLDLVLISFYNFFWCFQECSFCWWSWIYEKWACYWLIRMYFALYWYSAGLEYNILHWELTIFQDI